MTKSIRDDFTESFEKEFGPKPFLPEGQPIWSNKQASRYELLYSWSLWAAQWAFEYAAKYFSTYGSEIKWDEKDIGRHIRTLSKQLEEPSE